MKFLVIVFKNAWFVIKNFFGWMLRFAKHPEKRPIDDMRNEFEENYVIGCNGRASYHGHCAR